jgi:hypothetical protein
VIAITIIIITSVPLQSRALTRPAESCRQQRLFRSVGRFAKVKCGVENVNVEKTALFVGLFVCSHRPNLPITAICMFRAI